MFQNAVDGVQSMLNISAVQLFEDEYYIEAVVYQNSGNFLNMRGDTIFACRLSVKRWVIDNVIIIVEKEIN